MLRDLRRELGEFVYAQLLFNPLHGCHAFLESVLAENLVLTLLELIAQRVDSAKPNMGLTM